MNKTKHYTAPSVRVLSIRTSLLQTISTPKRGESPDERGAQGARGYWYEDDDDETENVSGWNL
jgi:hypothetical protein